MANVTQSLFGFTPQDIQAQRDAELDRRTAAFAQLTPMQQAQASFYRAGSMFGDAAAGALGYEDPEMAQARARQGLLGGLDIGDPNALRTAAANADPQTANLLIGRALELEKGIADVDAAKALADQRRREADPVQELAKTGKYTTASLGKYAQTRNVNDLVLTENLTQTEIEKLQLYRDSLTDPVKIAEVNKVIEGVSKGRGTTVTVSPTIKQGASVTDLMNNIDKLTAPDQEMLRSVETTKQLINVAATSNNSQAWEAARTQVAKAIGEGKLSNEDIRRTGVDPRLVQGALDWANKKIEGVPNQDIMKQLYTVASLLEKTSVDRINKKMGKARVIGTKEGGLSEDTAQTLFPDMGSSTGAVEWSQLKK